MTTLLELGEVNLEKSHQPGTVEAPPGASSVLRLIVNAINTFIREQIQTVPKLEVLLLLHREQSRPFTLAEVANELGFEIETAREQLTALEAIGLIETSKDKYRYHPVNTTLESIVDRLAITYHKQRVPILSAILAEDPNKVRRFVEAFKLTRSND